MFTKGEIVPEQTDHLIGELSFSLDDFRQQKVLYDGEAYGNMSKRLCLMRKGTFPSDPNMGIGIDTYRFHDLDILTGGPLKDEIYNQHITYIPSLTIEDIQLSTLKYRGAWILYIDIICLSDVVRRINHAYAQKNTSLISSDIKIVRPKIINPT